MNPRAGCEQEADRAGRRNWKEEERASVWVGWPAGWLRAVRDYGCQVLCVAMYYVLALGANCLAGVMDWAGIRRGDPGYWQGWIHRLYRLWLEVLDRLGGLKVDFPEGDNLAGLRGTLVIANHPGMLDAVVLLSRMPRAVCLMRARDFQSNPTLSTLARLADYLPSDRGPGMVRGAVERLRRGENVIIFPEGTRTAGERPGPLKRGFALMAKRSGAAVQVVFLRMEGQVFRKGVSLLRPQRLPVRIEARLGEKLSVRPEERPREFLARVEEYFRREAPSQSAMDGRGK